MQLIPKKTATKKEWEILLAKEARLIKKQARKKPIEIYAKLDDVIPEKLHETLNTAFRKAFILVFEKGTGVIEKTYNKQQHELDYKANEDIAMRTGNPDMIKSFTKSATVSQAKNLLISGVEGVGLGTLGIGIPDIPLFIGVLLKSIYEIALSYGFSYDTNAEKFFILILIRTAMEQGDAFQDGNQQLNTLIRGDVSCWEDITTEIASTSATLAEGMLYMKFIQGIPLVGMAGGLSDALYLKKITDYAKLKYQRRLLWQRMNQKDR
jgi:hypothetical protein